MSGTATRGTATPATQREVLTLVFHPGGVANSYSAFRIRGARVHLPAV